ncbi:MAG: L,D-transpeptidase family protein [Magnetospirillum sp.]|nr:L,D-transpeptidase family protein [Magnetospirillum sp.]
MEIRVSADAGLTSGRLTWDSGGAVCALGRAGVRADKREGDGATPVGCFRLKRVFYRPDRLAAPVTGLPRQALDPGMGWCDDPAHPDYNRPVRLPHAASCERMWRDDSLYDVVVELGHNDDPPLPGMGSAIFLHVAKPDYAGTEGCVALALADLLAVLAVCRPGDRLMVDAPAGSHYPAGL